MKRHFSIFLLTIYRFSFTEVKEVLKIPALIEHYQEHKSENKNISIIGFIALHYLSGSQKDSDYEKDMKFRSLTDDGEITGLLSNDVDFNYFLIEWNEMRKKH